MPPRQAADLVNVDLWSWDLDREADRLLQLSSLLSEDETRRAARFIHRIHAVRYGVGRGRLREILASYRGCPPAELTFVYGAEGKPFLDGLETALFFNLSHSGSRALLGVANVSVGVDVEVVRPIEERVEDFFSINEQAALSRLPLDDRSRGFYRCWTRKEAVVKALGGGLSIGLAEFDVSLGADEPPRLLRLAPRYGPRSVWHLHSIEPEPGLIGAVAIRASGRPVRVTEHASRNTR